MVFSRLVMLIDSTQAICKQLLLSLWYNYYTSRNSSILNVMEIIMLYFYLVKLRLCFLCDVLIHDPEMFTCK